MIKQTRAKIEGLSQVYFNARKVGNSHIEKIAIVEISKLLNFVTDDTWSSVHIHDAYPDVDIRMLITGCPIEANCPLCLAMLYKANMSPVDYTKYRNRAGNMIAAEHNRKFSKVK